MGGRLLISLLISSPDILLYFLGPSDKVQILPHLLYPCNTQASNLPASQLGHAYTYSCKYNAIVYHLVSSTGLTQSKCIFVHNHKVGFCIKLSGQTFICMYGMYHVPVKLECLLASEYAPGFLFYF